MRKSTFKKTAFLLTAPALLTALFLGGCSANNDSRNSTTSDSGIVLPVPNSSMTEISMPEMSMPEISMPDISMPDKAERMEGAKDGEDVHPSKQHKTRKAYTL